MITVFLRVTMKSVPFNKALSLTQIKCTKAKLFYSFFNVLKAHIGLDSYAGDELGVVDGTELGAMDGDSLGADDGDSLGVDDGVPLGIVDGSLLG